MLLERKLTLEEQEEILGHLFGFEVDERGVIYNEDGYEFHGITDNDPFDLSTLKSIFEYIKKKSTDDGVWEKQQEIRKVLGLL